MERDSFAPNFENGFICVPVKAINAGLTGVKLLVFSAINDWSSSGEWCSVSQERLAKLCGTTRPTVNRAIKWLLENGFIEKRDRREDGFTYCEYWAKDLGEREK